MRAGIGAGLRVCDVDSIVPGDEDAARPAEMTPFVEIGAVLIEDHDPVVLAISHEESPARVQSDRVRLAHLAASGAFLAPLLDVRAVLAESDDAIVLAVAVAVGDKNIASRRDDDVGRLIEQTGGRAADARLAERHERFALGTELEDLVALPALAARVGHPEIAVAIHRRAVREVEQTFAPALEEPAAGVVFQDRRLRAAGARIGKAAVDDVDRPVGRGLDGGDGGPLHAWRKLTPVAGRAVGLRKV